MRLRDLLNDPVTLRRETLIGREIDVQGKKALILGLREVEEIDEGELEVVAKLAVLHEESMDDEFWDEDDEDWDDDRPQTNRQVLIEALDTDGDISTTDLDALIINGERYEVNAINVTYLEEQPYEEMMLIRDYAEKGCITEAWLDQEPDLLALAEYTVDPAMFDLQWGADILNITAEMVEPVEEVLVGKVIKCTVGHYDEPREFIIKGRDGEDIVVRLHGVYVHDIWTDISCLDMDFSELEDYCDRDQRLLVVEYSTEPPLQMEFYTKEYLDAWADDDDLEHISEIGALSIGVITDGPQHELCVVDVEAKDFDGEVEIELLSYTI